MHIPFDHRPICSKVDFQPDRCVDCVSLYSSNKITQGLGNNLVTDSIPADDLISEKRWVGAHVLVRDTPGEYELPKIVCLLGVQIRAHLLENGNTLETSMLGSSTLEVQSGLCGPFPPLFAKHLANIRLVRPKKKLYMWVVSQFWHSTGSSDFKRKTQGAATPSQIAGMASRTAVGFATKNHAQFTVHSGRVAPPKK